MDELNKMWIINFNRNKTKELYATVLKKYFPDYKKCKDCNGVIYYYDSTFTLYRGIIIQLHKKSYLSTKKLLNNEYNLCVCEDCLSKKFPEYINLNKSRVFNRVCDITIYAYNIPKEIGDEWISKNYSITEKTLIKKYGKKEGRKKWKLYCDKQALSNTFEYKKQKYGWSELKYKKFNQSRAVTLDNLIKKHGDIIGLEKWKTYCDRQKYTCSLEYFIKTYGEIEGLYKYNNFAKKRASNIYNIKYYSDVSQILFNKLDELLNNKYTLYYATKRYEYKVTDVNNTIYYLDFYIKELNIAIEFNGDVWHCNPEKYKPIDKPLTFLGKSYENVNAEDIWNKDKKRLNFLKTKLKDIIIVWEHDLKKDGLNKTVNNIIGKIKLYEQQNNIN